MVDLNIEDKNGWTPLHHAVRNNALNATEFLLDNGVNDIRLNEQEEAPIHLAVIHNQLKALEVFFFFVLFKDEESYTVFDSFYSQNVLIK